MRSNSTKLVDFEEIWLKFDLIDFIMDSFSFIEKKIKYPRIAIAMISSVQMVLIKFPSRLTKRHNSALILLQHDFLSAW